LDRGLSNRKPLSLWERGWGEGIYTLKCNYIMPIMPDVPAQLLKRARSLRRSATKSEDIFWKRIRNGQISGLKFRRQVPIHGLIVDFACFSHRLVVEIDGGIHGLSEVQQRDQDRDAKLKHFGYRVLRFSDRAIFEELETVIGLIEEFARLR
jgi:very-short-patch-repair endonuclease